jgi:hypothetical protein
LNGTTEAQRTQRKNTEEKSERKREPSFPNSV